jgi:hypothetical protein
MPLSDTIEPGSISHGTMRECDLIPTFMSTLHDFSPSRAAAITDEYGAAFIERCSTEDGLDYSLTNEMERQSWLLESLFDALDDIAPEGYYFGAIEGDGSDYGFWPAENEGY